MLRSCLLPLSLLAAAPALAAPDLATAERVFADAKAISDRDHGGFWGKPLYGPILVVDYTDNKVIANQADASGVLRPSGRWFAGTLPDSVIIANTPTEWSGVRWTQLAGPIPEEEAKRHVLIAHELFHRIQPSLGLTRPEQDNHHLDTLEGRWLLQLEWRALAKALTAASAPARRAAIGDALLFRRERYRLFPDAAKEEGALEVNEGVPEYTGVRLGLADPAARVAYAVYDLGAFVGAPSFVRSFAYATGPAYGLLLDRADPKWRAKLATARFDEMLADAMRLKSADPAALPARAKLYDDGTLRAAEEKRDADRRARLASLKAALVDGPVLILPLSHSNYQFNPQTLVPLEGYGTIYPTMRLTDDWGALEVASGGALVRSGMRQATVTAKGADAAAGKGDGWTLSLKPGWTVRPGTRPGDLIVARQP